MLDSVVKAKKKYYPQIILEECKFEPKKIKMVIFIDDDLEKSSSDGSDNEDDNDSMIKQNLTTIMVNLTNNLLKAKKVF